MRIASFVTKAVRITREPGQFAPREEGDFVTLRLRTDDGIEGIAYAGFISPLATKALKEMLDALAAETVGADPHAVEEIGRGLLAKAGDGSPAGIVTRAVSAIDVALWDIRGKALDMPVWRLLGAGSGAVPTYASGHLWRRDGLDTLAEAAAELAGQGFRAMKLRLGGETSAKAEVARLCAVREVVGEGVDVMVDINQGWDVNRTIAVGRSMAEHNLFWLEDPIHFQAYTGLARIAEALDTPIAVGEYHYGIEPFRHMLEAGSIDIVMVPADRGGYHAVDEGRTPRKGVQPSRGDTPHDGDPGAHARRSAERALRGAHAVGVPAVRGGPAGRRRDGMPHDARRTGPRPPVR